MDAEKENAFRFLDILCGIAIILFVWALFETRRARRIAVETAGAFDRGRDRTSENSAGITAFRRRSARAPQADLRCARISLPHHAAVVGGTCRTQVTLNRSEGPRGGPPWPSCQEEIVPRSVPNRGANRYCGNSLYTR